MKKEHFEILLEEMNSKFTLVLEGHHALRQEIRETREESNAKHEHTAFLLQTLNAKVDAVDARLSRKIDDLAADLSAHRADTEAHHGVYRVKEESEEFGGGGGSN